MRPLRSSEVGSFPCYFTTVAISYSTRDSALVSTDDLFGAPGKPDAAAGAVQVWFTYARYKYVSDTTVSPPIWVW